MPAAPSARALEIARALVRFNTVSRESNLALIEFIRAELARHGVASRLTFDDERRKANLFATIGAGKPAGVIVSGHTDTVPWDGQEWSVDPLGAELRDGRLYGRGSADMKGFIGLAVAQVPTFLAADLPFAVHLAFSYDEEVGGFGARRLIADMKAAGVTPLACIVGEPTGMVPALAHKGVYRWRCCVRGHAAHSSLTPQSVNAIEVGARVIGKLADMAERWRDHEPRYEGFDVPYSTGSVGVVAGGIADNVVPADCRFHYEFRNLPGADVAAMQGEVRAYAETLEPAMRAVDAEAGIRFETICEMPAFLARADDPAVLLAQRLVDADATTLVAFGTEAGLFQGAGVPTVVCGPGRIAQAHQADEYVSLAQLAAGERFLLALTRAGVLTAGRR
ncbi:MAG TPA: acetylornithine deacetylase [Caldimonas sp.]|nr:acetylornithine deacetylase [Caldimonas sp.]HEV7576456.1 acetylornithine deacetylase [Caldimonas sp.]